MAYPKMALVLILIVSLVGILFSGYFSYTEIFQGSCALGGCSNLYGYPTCVYGLGMYLLIFLLAWFGLKSRGHAMVRKH